MTPLKNGTVDMEGSSGEELTNEEIDRRRDDAIKRALSTPRQPPNKSLNKGQRAEGATKSRVKKSARSAPKKP